VGPPPNREGLAREVVRRIQGARKDAGYNIQDRIEVRYRAAGELAEAIADWSEHISQETLAVSLQPLAGTARDGEHTTELKVEGEEFALDLALNRV